jgi:spermidine synthase
MNNLLKFNIFTSERDLFGNPIIYRTNDALGDLLVIDHHHYRSLTFDSIYEQSSMDLRRPFLLVHEYMRAMMLVLAFINPQHATLLGLGGGCLLRSLYHILPDCNLQVVELRHRVHEIAADFFGLPTSDRINITIADAKHLLKHTKDANTDIIFADMYHADGMNPLQIQQQFIKQCHRILNDAGWLVINYHDLPDANSAFCQYIHSLFSDLLVCTLASGNNILFASKQQLGDLQQFDTAIPDLEEKLESSLMHLFKRLTRLNAPANQNE